jgi:hypothetical protein
VDSTSGVVIAGAAGSAEITATAEGKSGKVRVTVLPQPRTSRAELAAESQERPVADARPVDGDTEQRRAIEQMRAGVEQCYDALLRKDVARVEELYRPETKDDREKLKKLSRILRTSEWQAQVGERKDGVQRIEESTAFMDFGFRLAWKDAFGGRLSSSPMFRAEFARNGNRLDLTSCRIRGSPRL